MYYCAPSSTQIRCLNFNGYPQGSFLVGQKLVIAATQKLFLYHGEGGKLVIGAVCSVLKHYLHSRKDANAKYPNAAQLDRLEGHIVVYQGLSKVNHKDQVCIFFDTMTSLTNAFIVCRTICKSYNRRGSGWFLR